MRGSGSPASSAGPRYGPIQPVAGAVRSVSRRHGSRCRLWQNAPMRKQELLIGCRGWDHDGWVPAFYPPELPADWRFCFYSNQHRSVLVPEHQLAGADAGRAAGWRDDCDDEFRFVFELTAALLAPSARRARAVWQRQLAPVRHLTAGFLVTGAAGHSLYPPAVEAFPGARLWWGGPGEVPAVGTETEPMWGRVWRPQREVDPESCDVPLLALAETLQPRRLRGVLETLAEVASRTGTAALFFDDERNGHASSRDARILAELMGIV